MSSDFFQEALGSKRKSTDGNVLGSGRRSSTEMLLEEVAREPHKLYVNRLMKSRGVGVKEMKGEEAKRRRISADATEREGANFVTKSTGQEQGRDTELVSLPRTSSYLSSLEEPAAVILTCIYDEIRTCVKALKRTEGLNARPHQGSLRSTKRRQGGWRI
ncbi:hypothetical protein GUITHDRAFT_154395 [Guillardia theta CCMP2712]|uniref:Uncharacterized protein n=1 Tax=Guillardia theta (strain CCMP2712) TaxID=905079 RepID=L1ITQ4_GUITC|nr:hypothetical protein GUITHDRAFT_154395 [Guillardia theta CCMP2712]EKX39618.1 hypothetical protein GUITHDRAFT_154395 [Guillardia theta CCMP2712]|eukprot:XP_005826598.1 hypothetical protein GUITHDRAFT_154395 [Guillardia theta CCMP2712]